MIDNKPLLMVLICITLLLVSGCNNKSDWRRNESTTINNNKQLKALIFKWKEKGLYTDKKYRSKEAAVKYINSLGSFDLSPIQTIENTDSSFRSIGIENDYFSISFGYWKGSGIYTISSISINDKSKEKYSLNLKDNSSFEELVEKYGIPNPNGYADNYYNYYTKYHQGLNVITDENGKIISYSISNDYF